MGPHESPDQDDPEEFPRRDDILNDLTIIQAQAQLMMRRIEASGYVDHNDTYRRLVVVVEAVQRLTRLHR